MSPTADWFWGTIATTVLLIGIAHADEETKIAPTVANILGAYELDTDRWLAETAGDTAFHMISERLEIGAETLTFAPTFAGEGHFTLVDNNLTVTFQNGFKDLIQASLANSGNTLTLVDTIRDSVAVFVFERSNGAGTSNDVTEDTLQGTYALDLRRSRAAIFPLLVSGTLEIVDNVMTTSLTFSQTRPYSLDGSTITLTEVDGSKSLLRASLTESASTLALTFAEDDQTFVYMRQVTSR